MNFDYNKFAVDVDWPTIIRLKDDLYPFNGYDNIRYTARALIENENGQYGFLHIVGEDYFGPRNHLETCGGGLEDNESLDETLIREVHEEMGLKPYNIKLIGSIYDTYNLINRITFSTFFHCNVNSNEILEKHRTYEENILIKEILWLDPLEALDRLKNKAENKCDKIVQIRDYYALHYYLSNYTTLLK